MKTCTIDNCNKAHQAKGFCQMHYMRIKRYGDPTVTKKAPSHYYKHCMVTDCAGDPKSGGRGYCNRHYVRLTRYGNALIQLHASPGAGSTNDHGYRTIYAPDHALARKDGRALEHRVVLYDAIGDGPHLCNWGCGTELDWHVHKNATNFLTVDHINWERTDNRLENLVPSCNPCNAARIKRTEKVSN